jgi:ubiquinol-cytochrome c reductase iron-sulfur subunit
VTHVQNKYDTPDALIDENRLKPGAGADKRAFTYFVLGGARFLYASSVRLAVINLVATLSASADVLALAAVEVDLSQVAPGQVITVKWRGKPVFIKNRTEAQIKEVADTNIADFRHPQTDAERVKDPKWCVVAVVWGGGAGKEKGGGGTALAPPLLHSHTPPLSPPSLSRRLIVLGVCTHLGCVPISNAGDYNGWYCPCHGSHYDGSGRIRRGPAPLNLEIPEYKFIGDDKVVLG